MELGNMIVETMAFGRPFRLGMLYDCRYDKLFPGITLWDQDVLKKAKFHSRLQPHSNYTIKREDSLHDKTDLLEIEGSLKISLLSGLIDVAGSAKYANDRKMTEHQQRVTFKYSITIRCERLTMDHLSTQRMIHTEVLDQDIATHVVIGIVYGADAFFIFNRKLSKNVDSTITDEDVQLLLNKIPKLSISSKGTLNLNSYERKIAKLLTCTFYGDFSLKQKPNTFEDVVQLYKQLPTLLGSKSKNAVAKTVYLYPLRLLNKPNMTIIREISNHLLNQSVSLISDLHEFKIRARDLINDDYSIVYLNQKHLTMFVQCITEFEIDIQKTMMELLPKIRGNSVDEMVLADYLKGVQSSPFNNQALCNWINLKRREITMEERLIRSITEENVHSSPFSLDDMLGDIRCDFVFCLSLHLTDENDSFLSDLHNYLDKKTITQSPKETPISWIDDEEIIASSRTNVKLFRELAKANILSQNINFIIDDQYYDEHPEGILIDCYANGRQTVFDIPSKPDKPVPREIYHDRVLLTWTKPHDSIDHVQQYKIIYAKKNHNNWIPSLAAVHDSQTILIENLSPNTEYRFKVQAMTKLGIAMESDTSDPVVTQPAALPSPKILPDARWDQNSIIIAGGHGGGNAPNQLSLPHGLYVDDDRTVFIADWANHRIVEWKYGATSGRVVAGGNGQGNRTDQLNRPTDLIVDKETDSFIICDRGNRRVMQWPRHSRQGGEMIIPNIDCWGLTMDDQRSLYISDYKHDEVRRYRMGEKSVAVVAGGNGRGNCLNQFDWPQYVTVDRNHSVYVSDWNNHRVMKWVVGAKEGIIVAGGRGQGNDFTQLSYPNGVFLDSCATLYVADSGNNRVMRWLQDVTKGDLIAGGYGEGKQANQLNDPVGLSFDGHGNLYVVSWGNNQVQRFSIQAS